MFVVIGGSGPLNVIVHGAPGVQPGNVINIPGAASAWRIALRRSPEVPVPLPAPVPGGAPEFVSVNEFTVYTVPVATENSVVPLPAPVVTETTCGPPVALPTPKVSVSDVVLVTFTLLTVTPVALTCVEPTAKFVPVTVSLTVPALVAADHTLNALTAGTGNNTVACALAMPVALAVIVGFVSKAAV